MKRRSVKQVLIYLSISIFLLSCGARDQESSRILIGVTTSYIECAVRDVSGAMFDYVRIAPPGMCPGHFDLSPKMARDLKKSSALFRFDFQKSLDEKIRHWNRDSSNIHSITAPEGLCIPESYRLCLKEVYEALCKSFPDMIPSFDTNMKETLVLLEALEKECGERMKDMNLIGVKVAVSGHHEYFCRWLGMDVVASYSGSESTTPHKLKEILDKGRESGISFIIANLQEGGRQAEALSAHLSAPLVFFSNFPDMSDNQNSFFALVRSNLDELEKARRINESF